MNEHIMVVTCQCPGDQVCKFSMTISLKFKVYLETSLRKSGIFSKYRIRKSDIFGPSIMYIKKGKRKVVECFGPASCSGDIHGPWGTGPIQESGL